MPKKPLIQRMAETRDLLRRTYAKWEQAIEPFRRNMGISRQNIKQMDHVFKVMLHIHREMNNQSKELMAREKSGRETAALVAEALRMAPPAASIADKPPIMLPIPRPDAGKRRVIEKLYAKWRDEVIKKTNTLIADGKFGRHPFELN